MIEATLQIGVYVSPSMPVNWKGRVAIRDVSRRSRGDFQLHELVDLIPSPCVVFDLAPLLLARGCLTSPKGSDKRNSDLRIWSISSIMNR